jgi:hypothetical protein
MDNDNFTIKISKINNSYFIKQLQLYTHKEFFLKYKENLTPYFCFRYLYNPCVKTIQNKSLNNENYNKTEIDNNLYYNEIYDHFKHNYILEKFNYIFDIAIHNKLNTISFKNVMNTYGCNNDCKTCVNQEYCF